MAQARQPTLTESTAAWRQRLRHPWLIAAWPGMGIVGQLAVAELARQLGAAAIAELPTDAYFGPRAVDVTRGLVQVSPRPRHTLFGWQDPAGGRGLVLLGSEAQPEHDGHRLAEDVMAVARDLGVERVITFAAMASMIRPDAAPRVFVAASERSLLDESVRSGAVSLADGSIGGQNGILVEVAARRDVPSLCLLGEMPFYASAIPNPKSAAAVLRVFGRLAGVRLDFERLDAEAATVEKGLVEHLRRMAAETERATKPAPSPPEAEVQHVAPDPAEAAAAARIEELFAAAAKDRSKAQELKAELDRLDRFRQYEDRFLDLFKRAE